MTSAFSDQLRGGMDVFDAEDENIGTVDGSGNGHMRVPSGFLGMGKSTASGSARSAK
jgi:hypothetical protein